MTTKQKASAAGRAGDYTDLTVRVNRHDARASASINPDLQSPESAYLLDDTAHVYQFATHLEVFGTCIAPISRAGDDYHLSLFSERSPSSGVNRSLKLMQERDESDIPKYRMYRGRRIPVYRQPLGLALMSKIRGRAEWTIYVPAAPRFVSDVLVLLGQGRDVYITLYERKIGRRRWLQYLTFQTDDPLDEG